MARLTPLPAPVPETLEALLGYEGDAEWLALYVERNFGEVVGDEGNLPFVLAEDAYRLYTEHQAVAPHLAGYDLEGGERPARSRLLLNRRTRTLYVASARAVRARVRAQWPEPPRPPQGAEVGAVLAQWTWRLRAEETPAGQAAHARAMATRPRELQGLRSWLDAQAALVLHSQPPEPIAIMARRSLAEVTHDHKEEEESSERQQPLAGSAQLGRADHPAGRGGDLEPGLQHPARPGPHRPAANSAGGRAFAHDHALLARRLPAHAGHPRRTGQAAQAVAR